ncbi:hypothetical protein LLEC1_01296 [Akanthomyces lecanii]|uniref:MYND-type domain-containing protein n=1 Tax=Cordyceps confragosa TaxID=2714763 RepID=A0A179ILZ3_CORDF|nr:hypothetical protein LLEC1_01296 [Akanthomyces lecanii]
MTPGQTRCTPPDAPCIARLLTAQLIKAKHNSNAPAAQSRPARSSSSTDCQRCPTTKYCGRACQTAHWPVHRSSCGSQTTASSAARPSNSAKLSPPKGLQQGIAHPFTRLDKGTWLHDRPQKDVYALLIDAYRLRVEDLYNLEGEAETDSLYGGAPNGLGGFRRFLASVAARPGLLPPWWDATKKKECEELGMDADQWPDLQAAVEKSDIIDHYGDSQFPMQLRMFAEAVYGKAPGGSSGSAMRAMLMAMEQGNSAGLDSESIDISKIFSRR